MLKLAIFLIPTIFTYTLFYSVSVQAKEEETYKKALIRSEEICETIFFPNSMARTDGPRSNEEFQELEGTRKDLAKTFFNNQGIEYIRKRLISDKDEVNDVCMLKILSASQIPRAISIVQYYTEDRSDEGYEPDLAEHAREILGTQKQ